MQNPTTPGVSVEEITRLPNSISLVDTAIPAFIGYTQLTPVGYTNKPRKISSLLEYKKYFGEAKEESIRLQDIDGKGIQIIAPEAKFLMYYSLQMYFANGGGPCYIVSVGNYTEAGVQYPHLNTGLEAIKDIEELSLIVFPDAVSLTDEDEFYLIYKQAIQQAKSIKNRFLLLDTYLGDSTILSDNKNTIENLRKGISELTTHAAAYFPHLTTILNYTFDEDTIPIVHKGLQKEGQTSAVFYAKEINALTELQSLASAEIESGNANGFVLADLLSQTVAITAEINETADEMSNGTPDAKAALVKAIEDAQEVVDAIRTGIIDDFVIPEGLNKETPLFKGEFSDLIDAILGVKDEVGAADGLTLQSLQLANSALYHQVKKEIMSLKVVLPPSSTMAGLYGRIDNVRGVWKAPANVSLSYVTAPTEKISDKEQSTLNVHDSGSINTIRTFTGKGHLVWGARTFDGQNENWKYINVRRYYDLIELSIKRALVDGKFINQPNIPHTWLKAKTMIENFLNQQWVEGALAGSTPEEAYDVKVKGDDIKPKTMNISIEIALSRPAEFITLNFSHQLQQS
ncbi:phage tail sheath C-terminal domain-containing protein [Chryseobacterium sp. MYb264]|uniref:phage tail sheath family protein n=1 Tax=Chryseobacterium sp. MYb264 TaxID=2745153 RepID=UPI002E0FDCC5|nr:phage tail sheath C-terminal domain-containing protein [Chryseobacterium sp. MYb264]